MDEREFAARTKQMALRVIKYGRDAPEEHGCLGDLLPLMQEVHETVAMAGASIKTLRHRQSSTVNRQP